MTMHLLGTMELEIREISFMPSTRSVSSRFLYVLSSIYTFTFTPPPGPPSTRYASSHIPMNYQPVDEMTIGLDDIMNQETAQAAYRKGLETTVLSSYHWAKTEELKSVKVAAAELVQSLRDSSTAHRAHRLGKRHDTWIRALADVSSKQGMDSFGVHATEETRKIADQSSKEAQSFYHQSSGNWTSMRDKDSTCHAAAHLLEKALGARPLSDENGYVSEGMSDVEDESDEEDHKMTRTELAALYLDKVGLEPEKAFPKHIGMQSVLSRDLSCRLCPSDSGSSTSDQDV